MTCIWQAKRAQLTATVPQQRTPPTPQSLDEPIRTPEAVHVGSISPFSGSNSPSSNAKERERQRLREQERRKRETVSVCKPIIASKESIQDIYFLQMAGQIDLNLQNEIMANFEEML